MYQNTMERWFPHAFLRKLGREVLRKLRKKTKTTAEGTVRKHRGPNRLMQPNIILIVGFGRHPCAATITPEEME
jgi:hypothetical protein